MMQNNIQDATEVKFVMSNHYENRLDKAIWKDYIKSFEDKVDEPNDLAPVPVKGTRHPSTRHERWKATSEKKKADRQKAMALGMNSPWKEPTRSKWVDPYLKHNPSLGDTSGYLPTSCPNPSKKRRAEGKREVQEFQKAVPDYPELTDQVWEQAWKDWTEEQYWEEVEAQEWGDMQTFDEIEEYYSHESGLARESGIEPDEPEDDLEDGIEPEDLSSIGVTNNNPYVWEYGVISEGRRFVCEDEESAIWLLHRLEAFYPASTDFSPRLVRR